MILVVILTYVLGNGFWSSPGYVGLPFSRSARPAKLFYGNGDVSPCTFSLLLFLVSVSATFKHDEVCHVNEVLKVINDEQRARTQDDRPPDFGEMSLAEVGLALKSQFLAPRTSQQRRW